MGGALTGGRGWGYLGLERMGDDGLTQHLVGA